MRAQVSRVNNDLILENTNPAEIKFLVSKLKPKRSCGYDDIPMTLIKNHIDILATPLANFINQCFETCVFPEQLKVAKVLPLHKKGAKTDPNNYRPISLLPIISKLLEKVMKERLTKHLLLNDVISNRQYGYQKGKGTTEAVSAFINDVVVKLNDKKRVAGVLLDLSSAFDVVNHSILLGKLEHYGIRGGALALFKSYLANRKQFVEIQWMQNNRIKSHRSRLADVYKGVPQGSILGPILFIVFTNDLITFMHNNIHNSELFVFADDTNAVISADNITELNQRVNYSLEKFIEWFMINKLQLNYSKTNVLLFKSTARVKDSLQIKMRESIIKEVDSAKFLGVHIDDKLNWKTEVSALLGSLSSACYALRSLRDELQLVQLKMVYYALVESKIRYSIRFWGYSYRYNTQAIFVAQKRAIRIMANISQQTSCRPYYIKYKILTVPCLYILVVLMDMIKHINDLESPEQRDKRLATRRKNLPQIFSSKLKVAKHTASYQAVLLFNKLPVEYKMLDNTLIFKNKLTSFLEKKCFYSVEEYFSTE